uniref:Uncharacterized protein n=1 Tax=Arion vulgaris TaxID=1028688 RepID=A0A0B7B638_9EUPU
MDYVFYVRTCFRTMRYIENTALVLYLSLTNVNGLIYFQVFLWYPIRTGFIGGKHPTPTEKYPGTTHLRRNHINYYANTALQLEV